MEKPIRLFLMLTPGLGLVLRSCMIYPLRINGSDSEVTMSAPSNAADDRDASRIPGESKVLFGGTVTSWYTENPDGSVSEVGFTLPIATIAQARTTLNPGENPHVPNPENSIRLHFPTRVSQTTFVDHLDVDYNPMGHPPEKIYTLPHFDLHFYGISADEQMKIDCQDTREPGTGVLPPNTMVGKAGPPPGGECVPAMGRHVIDLLSPELAPTNPEPFTKTMILGYYNGKINFIEPMITREYFLRKQNFILPVPHPPVLGRQTRFPSVFSGTYDPQTDSYFLTLSGFSDIQ